MANPFFQFKQFTIYHNKCAMKVGTDGVLLGAWADVSGVTRALDVGTGTGLIALMLAQRSESLQLAAIDIDEGAVLQATENVAASPWGERIGVEQADFVSFVPAKPYELIVSNPPYFQDSLKSPNDSRTAARHTDSLGFDQLVAKASELLAADGRFCVVIPTDAMAYFLACCDQCGLFLYKRLLVVTKPGAAPKRVLLELRKKGVMGMDEAVIPGIGATVNREVDQAVAGVTAAFDGAEGAEAHLSVGRALHAAVIEEELVVELARHQYSAEYTALTRAFYLKM